MRRYVKVDFSEVIDEIVYASLDAENTADIDFLKTHYRSLPKALSRAGLRFYHNIQEDTEDVEEFDEAKLAFHELNPFGRRMAYQLTYHFDVLGMRKEEAAELIQRLEEQSRAIG